jgi:hypothetical protein
MEAVLKNCQMFSACIFYEFCLDKFLKYSSGSSGSEPVVSGSQRILHEIIAILHFSHLNYCIFALFRPGLLPFCTVSIKIIIFFALFIPGYGIFALFASELLHYCTSTSDYCIFALFTSELLHFAP